jgi:nucleotide-binding universal stress UspA family protein
MPSRRILVGVDGSDGSLAAVRWAAEVAAPLDAEIIAVFVAEMAPTALTAPAGMGDVSPGVDTEWLENMTKTLREQWCAPLAESGATWQCDVISGSPSHALLAAADEVHADLIAIGRHGHGRLAERLMGSTPNYIAHHATQPVVVVPPA